MDINNLLSKVFFLRKNKESIHNQFVNLSYSQEGEDLILDRVLSQKKQGFYVDIGAHHPKRFSNTYKFYLKGWNGINIDPLPGTKALFDRYRPRDLNLELGIGEEVGQLNYYLFNEPALNTFDEIEAKTKDGNYGYFIKDSIKIKTFPLSDILEQHLEENTIIDFLTIDVEGFDLKVLQSNNWNKFKPRIILVEELRTNISIILKSSPVNLYLTKLGYELFYRTMNTSFYVLK